MDSKCTEFEANSASTSTSRNTSHSHAVAPNDMKIDPIIALIDMDCFYVQVELRREPQFRGKPSCVVQYKTRLKGGGIIALSYEARAKGVKRFHHADEAREVCPEIKVFVVPELNGKADLTRYREGGAEVIQVMKKKFSMVERASVDEAFVDLTGEVSSLLPRYLTGELFLEINDLGATYVSGADSTEIWLNTTKIQRETCATETDRRNNLNKLALAVAAKLINELRQDILATTQFHCSAGMAYSKTLAKLACGMNKPQKQTILPAESIPALFSKTPITEIRFLGGKLGKLITQHLGIETMGELCKVPRASLLRYFDGKTTDWLVGIAQGHDNEAVQPRDQPKSIGCSKNFMGKDALKTKEDVKTWLNHFSTELSARLRKDQTVCNRTATLMTVHATYVEHEERRHVSRCGPLTSYEVENLAKDGFAVADKLLSPLGVENGRYTHPVISLGITASKMKDGAVLAVNRIDSYFMKSPKKEGQAGAASSAELPEEVVLEVEEEDDCLFIEETSGREACRLPSLKTLATTGISTNLPAASRFDESNKASPSKGQFDFKTTYQTELLLHPDFKIHRCPRCQELMWYPSMKAEHDDYHMALDLSKEPEPDRDGQSRKKLKLADTVVIKAKKPAPATLDRFLIKRPA